jgi:hypothetical protein
MEIEEAADQLTEQEIRELMSHLSNKLASASQNYRLATGADGLPVIRGAKGIITARRVKEIEGLVS